jgi:hypothetical protein
MTEALPNVLQEIAGLVGVAGAIAIAERRGGTRVYFPTTTGGSDTHWLVECVGQEGADRLCSHFAVDGRGQRVEIPLCSGGTFRRLARAIHQLDQDGASSAEIVRQVGVTQRTVHRHRARHGGRKNDKQGRLL